MEDCPWCGSTETHSVSIGMQTVEHHCDSCGHFFRVFIDEEDAPECDTDQCPHYPETCDHVCDGSTCDGPARFDVPQTGKE